MGVAKGKFGVDSHPLGVNPLSDSLFFDLSHCVLPCFPLARYEPGRGCETHSNSALKNTFLYPSHFLETAATRNSHPRRRVVFIQSINSQDSLEQINHHQTWEAGVHFFMIFRGMVVGHSLIYSMYLTKSWDNGIQRFPQ